MSHLVDWSIDAQLGVRGRVRCNDLDCDGRKVCDRPECIEGCVDPDSHPLRQVNECNIETWLREDDFEECYVGPSKNFAKSWITVEWNGNGYDWRLDRER